jgi:hypothetical protein
MLGRILANIITGTLLVFCLSSLFLTFVVDFDIISELAWHDIIGTALAHAMFVVLCLGFIQVARNFADSLE